MKENELNEELIDNEGAPANALMDIPDVKPEYLPFINELHALAIEGKYDEYVAKLIEKRYELFWEDRDKLGEFVLSIKNYWTTVYAVDPNTHAPSENTLAEIKAVYFAMAKARDNLIIEVSPTIDKWVDDLKNHRVKGAELIEKDSEIKAVAHDLALCQGKTGLQAADIVQLIADFNDSISNTGMMIGEELPHEYLANLATEQTNSIINEKNVSEEDFVKHRDVVNEINFGTKGYIVNYSEEIQEDNLFSARPALIETIYGITTDEEVEAFLEPSIETVGAVKSYERDVKAAVEVAKELLARLRATEAGHGQSDSYKAFRDALENFTKLGTGFVDHAHDAVSDKIINYTVSTAFEELKIAANAYEKAHSGMKNIHRSNVGYGAERLSVSRDVNSFVNARLSILDKYGVIIDTVESAIAKENEKLSLLNKHRAMQHLPKPPVVIDFNRVGPASVRAIPEEQRAAQAYMNIGNGTPVQGLFEQMAYRVEQANSTEEKVMNYFELTDYDSACSSLRNFFNREERDKYEQIKYSVQQTIKGLNTIDAIDDMCKVVGRETAKSAMDFYSGYLFTKNRVSENDPNRELKVQYLCNNTKAAQELETRMLFMGDLKNNAHDSVTVKQTIVSALKIKRTMLMTDFAKACGFKGADYDKFIADNHITPNDTVFSFYTFKKRRDMMHLRIRNNKELTDEQKTYHRDHMMELYADEINNIEVKQQDIIDAIANNATNYYISNQLRKGEEAYMKSKGKTYSNYMDMMKLKKSEKNYAPIREWISSNGEGRKLADHMLRATARGFINEFNNKCFPVQEKTYDQYMKLHTAYEVTNKDIKKTPDILAKAIAAAMLKKSGKEFSVKAIHATANAVKELSEYKKIVSDKNMMLTCLADKEAVERTSKMMLERTYGVGADNISAYVNKMNKLFSSMHPTGSQSTEYQNFKAAVQSIANLKNEYNLNNPEGRANAAEKVIQLNANLLAASTKYTSGKEAVRGTEEGQMRFNNALDSLGLLVQYSPELNDQVMQTVNKINKVRKAANTKESFVNIKEYDEKRAAKAYEDKQAREAERQAGPNRGH